MSKYIEVLAIVEGKTEEIFINSILQPYLAQKMIFMKATQVSKAGQKGGDVKFSKVVNDIERHLKQRSDTFVTTLIDYYGTKEWPGLDKVVAMASPAQIAEVINRETSIEIDNRFSSLRAKERFIPNMAIHEFEAFHFSEPSILSSKLNVSEKEIVQVLKDCKEPEAINNSRETAPSKRLDKWSKKGKFAKTTTGIAIAKTIGIDAIRKHCPVFNDWIVVIEKLTESNL